MRNTGIAGMIVLAFAAVCSSAIADPVNGSCNNRPVCVEAHWRDPFTPPQTKTDCTGTDWLSWLCTHDGCPRGCTGYATRTKWMENSLALYLEIPADYPDELRARAEASGRECLKEGYQAAGWATLESIAAAILSDGVSTAGASAYVLGRTQQSVQSCLSRESASLGRSLQNDMHLHASTDTHWSDWQ